MIKIADLSEKAMLVRLSISQWTARKHDKNVSKAVEKEYNAHDSGRFNKVLIAKEAIKAISQAAGDARTFHYENTLPWNDIGDRILPSANFEEYTRKMRELKNTFEAAVKNFVDNYQDYINEAKDRLNGMFKGSDYPHPAELARRYDFNTIFDPLPRGEDFRVSLNGDEIQAIQNEIEERLKNGQTAAQKELWKRLFTVVSAMVDRLSDPKAVFRDSLIGNVHSLIGLLPRLNITGDLSLEKARREIESQLCSYDPQILRDNKRVRREVAEKADKIKEAMAGYMGV